MQNIVRVVSVALLAAVMACDAQALCFKVTQQALYLGTPQSHVSENFNVLIRRQSDLC